MQHTPCRIPARHAHTKGGLRPLDERVRPVFSRRVFVEAPGKETSDGSSGDSAASLQPFGDERGLARAAPSGHTDQPNLRIVRPSVEPGDLVRATDEIVNRE